MRTALVTGASSGIGLAITKKLARCGDRVIAVARNKKRLLQALESIDERERVHPQVLDITDPEAQAALLSNLELDLVVASAGLCQQARLGERAAPEVWRKTMAVNLDAVFHLFHHVKLNRGASFLAISSGLGKNARPAYGAYCASKHALLGLIKCAALELAPRGIRVNAISPGWVDTPMSAADICATAERNGIDPHQLREEIMASIPIGRPVTPEEVADLALWLSSPQANAITGQSYNISGGEFFN